MYHDVKHKDDCLGLSRINPEPRDCTCGKVVERLQSELAAAQSLTAAFIDDHVANAIAQRNILSEALVAARVGASQDRAVAIDAAIAKAYPSGVELRVVGESVVRHLQSMEAAAAHKV